jgi:hypothetical protein
MPKTQLTAQLNEIGAIAYGGGTVNFAAEFERLASQLGSAGRGEWYDNLGVGLNHGYAVRPEYLVMMLDLLNDEVNEKRDLRELAQDIRAERRVVPFDCGYEVWEPWMDEPVRSI